MNDENQGNVEHATETGGAAMRRCPCCDRDIISVRSGVKVPDRYWIDVRAGTEFVEVYDSTIDVVHVTTCPVLRPRITTCGYCPQRIVWIRTKNDKRMSVVAISWDGREIYDPKAHLTHFADCPKSKELSRRGKEKR